MRRRIAAVLCAGLFALSCVPARADNPMGYRLVTQEDAASLPHNGGALGMDIERAQHISDDGLAFDIIRVKQVRRGSPGAQAGFKAGDQIIAVDGRVFASLTAFAGYVGSMPPGSEVKVDYIPNGGGPQQAQRLVATVGAAGSSRSCRPVHGHQARHRRGRCGTVRLLRTWLLFAPGGFADAGGGWATAVG